MDTKAKGDSNLPEMQITLLGHSQEVQKEGKELIK